MTDFSVSICVYYHDDPECFDIALSSVICQTCLPKEIVLTVDGPITEQHERIINLNRKKADSVGVSLKVNRLDNNQGHGYARRNSIENCSCNYVAIMDADDYSLPDRFEKQIKYFNNNATISIVGGQIREFYNDPADKTNRSNDAGMRMVPSSDAEIKSFLKKRCPMNQVTVMFKKDDIDEVGGYLDWFGEEDYYLWLRLALANKEFANVEDVLVDVRVDSAMFERRGGIKYFLSEAKFHIYMFRIGYISAKRLMINIIERVIIQLILPSKVRAYLYNRIIRD